MSKISARKPGNGSTKNGAATGTVWAKHTIGGASRDADAGVAGHRKTTGPLDEASAGPRGARKVIATEERAAQFPSNPLKPAEYGDKAARTPHPGTCVEPPDPSAGASTLSEANPSDKTGAPATAGENPDNAPLERHRVDSTGRPLTTNQGTPITDNQSSAKLGVRGPTLLEDFILREKIMHFDHERIPERVVHARGSGAHGYFECTFDVTRYTKAAPFAEVGKRTPVFVRFSTVAGERGSTDTARDVRGFAVKFYTNDGNWDLVGNNMPVFFIQDAIKFPDLIHAAKPEPHFAMPQAATAHDTFWDFVSLMPESTHMLMWAMSDRAIPRSYRMMQGFGVHTFRLGRRSGLPPPRSLGSDRGRRVSRVGARPPGLHRAAGRRLHVRRARFHEARPRGARAGDAGRAPRPRPEPRQLLRRNRAGRLLHVARRARHRFHRRPAAAGSPVLLRRSHRRQATVPNTLRTRHGTARPPWLAVRNKAPSVSSRLSSVSFASARWPSARRLLRSERWSHVHCRTPMRKTS